MAAPAQSWSEEVTSAAKVDDARWVAAAGRVALVWLPCYLLMGDRFGPSPYAAAGGALLAGVWLVSLRSAFAAVHFTLGPTVPTAVGTATGLVGVSGGGRGGCSASRRWRSGCPPSECRRPRSWRSRCRSSP